VREKAEADITIRWADKSADRLSKFDGPGGALADATKDGIVFDSAERWMSQKQQAVEGKRRFEFQPVALHEIGHVIGLVHSDNPEDVMWPYYNAGRVKLSEGDVAAVKALVTEKEAPSFLEKLEKSPKYTSLKDAFQSACADDGMVDREEFTAIMEKFNLVNSVMELNVLFSDYRVEWDEYINFMSKKKKRRHKLLNYIDEDGKLVEAEAEKIEEKKYEEVSIKIPQKARAGDTFTVEGSNGGSAVVTVQPGRQGKTIKVKVYDPVQ